MSDSTVLFRDPLGRPSAATAPTGIVLQPNEIFDAATRREFLAMLSAAGLLAACGDGGGTGSGIYAARAVLDDLEIALSAGS